MGVCVLKATLRPLYSPGYRPSNHCIGSWVDPRAGLLPPGFDPRTFQSFASRKRDHIRTLHMNIQFDCPPACRDANLHVVLVNMMEKFSLLCSFPGHGSCHRCPGGWILCMP